VSIFSNGTVTLQNGSGRNFTAEIISQTLVPESTTSSRQATTIDQNKEFPWKSVDDPNQHWKFTIRDQFVFAELAFPSERQQAGDFFTIDAKKRDGGFVGTARLRATVPGDAGSTKTCQWTFAIELTSVTPDRIEGKLSDEKDQEGCQRVGNCDNWTSAIWVRD